MARTKQTARKSTGGKAPRRQLAPSAAVLSWAELCEALSAKEVYPLKTFSNLLAELLEMGHGFEGFDFTGIDQVTDSVCLVLHKQFAGTEAADAVSMVSFVGCVHITDYAVKLLVQTFPALEKVHLDGCPQITEQSVVHLSNLPKLQELGLCGTGVAVAPSSDSRLSINLSGCPLIPQNQESTGQQRSQLKPIKIVILAKDTSMPCIMAFLQAGHVKNGNESIPNGTKGLMHFKPDVTLPGFGNQTFNLFECHSKTSLYAPFISWRAVYIFTLDVDELDNPQLYIMTRINNVREVSPHATFIILALHSNSSYSKTKKRLSELGQEMEQYLQQQRDTVDNHIEAENCESDLVQREDFSAHQRYSRMVKVRGNRIAFCILQVNTDTSYVELQWPRPQARDSKDISAAIEDTKKAIQLLTHEFYTDHWEDARRVLDGINKSDITELKSFSKPPPVVMETMKAVCIVLGVGHEAKTWKDMVRLVLNDLRMISKMRDFNLETLQDEVIVKLKKYIDNPELNKQKLAMVSKLVSAYWTWVEAIYTYGTDYKPKLDKHVATVQSLEVAEDASAETLKKVANSSRWNVCLSYCSADTSVDPRQIKKILETKGYTVWMDWDELRDDRIQGAVVAIQSCDVFMPCVSIQYAKSMMNMMEVRFAYHENIPIIPVDIGTDDQWKSQELGLLLSSLAVVNIQSTEKTEELFSLLRFYIIPAQLMQDRLLKETKDVETSAKERMQLQDAWEVQWADVLDKLDKVTQIDIDAAMAVTTPSRGANKCMQAVCVLFEQQDLITQDQTCWKNMQKKVLGSLNFLKSLKTYNLDSGAPEKLESVNDLTLQVKNAFGLQAPEEKLAEESVLLSAVWRWLLAVIEYNKFVKPAIVSCDEKLREIKLTTYSNCSMGPGLILKKIQAAVQILRQLRYYPEVSLKDSSALVAVELCLQDLKPDKMVKMSRIQEGLRGAGVTLEDRVVREILLRLVTMGICLCEGAETLDNLLVVTDIPWFMRSLTLLQGQWADESLANGSRCKALHPRTPLSSEQDNVTLLSMETGANAQQVVLLRSYLLNLGILLPVPQRSLQVKDGTEDRFFLHSHLQEKIFFRDGVDSGKSSGFQFVQKHWPEYASDQYLDTDVQIGVRYGLTMGIPPTLLPRILAEVISLGEVLLMSRWVILIRCGAAEVQLRHNLLSMMYSSSLDVEARVTSFDKTAQPAALAQYLWSAVSPLLTIIEYNINRHPNLLSRITIPCLGSCAVSGIAKSFSPTQFPLDMERQVECSKCYDKKMAPEDMDYLTGRQRVLPFHDFQDASQKVEDMGITAPYGRLYRPYHQGGSDGPLWVCTHCNTTDQASVRLWTMESSVAPGFACHYFDSHIGEHTSAPSECYRGSVLTAPRMQPDKPKTHAASFVCKQPLYLTGLREVHVTILQEGNISFVVDTADHLKSLQPGNLTQTGAQVIFDLQKGMLLERHSNTRSGDEEKVTPVAPSGDEKQPDKQTQTQLETFKPGDRFSLEVLGGHLLDIRGYTRLVTLTRLKKNGATFHSLPVAYRSHVALFLQSSETSQPKVVVHAPSYPMVTAAHFPLGSAVLYRTRAANQWAVGQVMRIEESQLMVEPRSSKVDLATHGFAADSADIMPVALFGDQEISLVLEKDSSKNAKQQLREMMTSCAMSPAVPGLFKHAFIRKEHYDSLSGDSSYVEPKFCTVNAYNPFVLENGYMHNFEDKKNKMTKTNLDLAHVYLPRGLSPRMILQPFRSLVQNWNSQDLVFVCSGAEGSDVHFMDKASAVSIGQEDKNTLAILRAVYVERILNVYHLMGSRQNIMPNWREMLPDLPADFPPDELMEGLNTMLETYRNTFILGMKLLRAATIGKKSVKEAKQILTKLYDDVACFDEKPRSLCGSHKKTTVTDANIRYFMNGGQPQSHYFGPYASCITGLTFDLSASRDALDDNVTKAINAMLGYCYNITYLASPRIRDLSAVCQLGRLTCLKIYEGSYTELPEDMLNLKDTLKRLHVNSTPLTALPGFITEFSKLQELNISNTLITELPEDFGRLRNLRRLVMKNNIITKLPDSFKQLRNLKNLNMDGLPWCVIKLGHRRSEVNMAYVEEQVGREVHSLLRMNPDRMPLSAWTELFDRADGGKKYLTENDVKTFHQELFLRFPRMGQDSTEEDKYGGFPPQVFHCRSLRNLSLRNQALRFVPDQVGNLRQLATLTLGDNPNMESLSPALGKVPLRVLDIKQCPELRTPPPEIVAQGMRTTIAYLKRLSQGSIASYRTKLMFVGLGGAGKTSLMRALMSKDGRCQVIGEEGITDGIDISTWTINQGGRSLTYSVWDFAGQTVYYNTHQFFLSPRAVYLLVWNTRLGFEHSGLEFWLSSIACHSPESPVFVVGTHADQITNSELPASALMRRFPCIKGFFTVSSIQGIGVRELLGRLFTVTWEQPYIGKRIPEAWLNLERAIVGRRKTNNFLQWSEIESLANGAGIHDAEVKQAVQFLDNMGALQYFDNEFLRQRVVINPQWIVDVMACVVSVHNKVIKEGRLPHNQTGVIWKDYPTAIHDWLLRLTEVFDLTFPLDEKQENIVPCLLPRSEPKFDWPGCDGNPDWRESKMIYQFEYLPAGLFNRVQVRLYQFSTDSAIWKTGSVLTKNGHHALIKQTKEQEVTVQAVGPSPEGIILLIHEIFEGLIADFFKGVKYEYFIPCSDCVKSGTSEPSMFSSAVLRRAIDNKAFFLQCHSFFHTLSLTEIQGVIPPQSGGEYEVQLQNAMRELDGLEQDMSSDTFFLLCPANVPPASQNASVVDPRTIKADLEEANISCWYLEELSKNKAENVILAMRTAKVILVFVSSEFVDDEDCQRLFLTMMNDLKKKHILLMVGQGRDWQQSSVLGGYLAGKYYINFQRMESYASKIKELREGIQKLSQVKQQGGAKAPDVFLSYCWINSRLAVEAKHARHQDEALGHGDPRAVKTFLEEHGLSCWLDIERVGGRGLFKDIAEGMRQCKVVLVCISDEYVLSENCQMEFRFAHISLKKPIILCVVGTGFRWESTEIGMLSLGYPKMNFQVANNVSHNDLLSTAREIIEKACSSGSVERPLPSTQPTTKEQAFRELHETAQRKFLRQLMSYAKDLEPYPRLFVADLSFDPSEEPERQSDAATNDIDLTLEDGSKPTFVVDQLLAGHFCIKVLCEYEKEWHCVHAGYSVELAADDLVELWELAAPYMARILAILKHSNINLPIVRTPEGLKLLKLLEDKAGVDQHSDMEHIYLLLRRFIMRKDYKLETAELKRCYLPSGKYLWLCEEHQKLPRVNVIEDDIEGVEEPDDNTLEEEELLQGLRKQRHSSMTKGAVLTDVGEKGSGAVKEPKGNIDIKKDMQPSKHSGVAPIAEPRNTGKHADEAKKSHKPNTTGGGPTRPAEPGTDTARSVGGTPETVPRGSTSSTNKKLSEDEKRRLVSRTSAMEMTGKASIDSSRACVLL